MLLKSDTLGVHINYLRRVARLAEGVKVVTYKGNLKIERKSM